MLREIVAFGASSRFSSHSFDKWCLPLLERIGSFSLGFMAFNLRVQVLFLTFQLNASKRHPGM